MLANRQSILGTIRGFCLALLIVAGSGPNLLHGNTIPLRLAPGNGHYIEFRGKTTVLVTAGEHYGAVINPDFDGHAYLKELHAAGLNLTRLFSGAYVEGEDSIPWMGYRNTLAPKPGRLLTPWARSDQPGYFNGGNRFDLNQWDTNYFSRLKAFVREAGRLGVVVEMVLFGNQYKSKTWQYSPMKASNNVNGVGTMDWDEFLTLRDVGLVSHQVRLVRKIVDELREFDNLYYEVANEPWNNRIIPSAWARHIIDVIDDAEPKASAKHLIALQDLQDDTRRIADPRVSIYNYHYTWGRGWVGGIHALNRDYGMKKVLALDETDGITEHLTPSEARVEAWEFLIGGGGIYSNLCWEYVPGNPRGDTAAGREVRSQLGVLKKFMDKLNLVDMRPDKGIIQGGLEPGTHASVLAEPGKSYVTYLHHGSRSKKLDTSYRVTQGRHRASPRLKLPTGSYRAEWLDPATGKSVSKATIDHSGGTREFTSPEYSEDILFVLQRR